MKCPNCNSDVVSVTIHYEPTGKSAYCEECKEKKIPGIWVNSITGSHGKAWRKFGA